MTKREFLDKVFALAPNEANAIMNAFDEYVESSEPHWIPVTEQPPEVGKSVLICDADGDICLGHRANYGYYFPDFCGDKIKNVRAWCELPEPFKGVTDGKD